MLILSSTSDLVQVITASAGTVNVHASWVDDNAGAITPGRTNTATIATATTTPVVASPAASTQRTVQLLLVRNNDASISNVTTIQHTDGTNVVTLWKGTLAPGESLGMNEYGEFIYYAASGVPQTATGTYVESLYAPSGFLAETITRQLCPEVNTAALTSGQLFMQAVYLKAGTLVTNISFFSATTAAGTPTHYMFGLFDSVSRNLLAGSTDQLTAAWAANTIKTLAMTAAYTVPTSGLYYLGIFVAATTVPTLKGGTARTGGQLAGTAVILNGNSSSTALTTALPNPAGAITVGTTSVWAAVS